MRLPGIKEIISRRPVGLTQINVRLRPGCEKSGTMQSYVSGVCGERDRHGRG
jgi:hypothetical protein